MNLGPTELIIVLLIVLLIFGGAKLPKLARSMGQASKEFKQGLTEGAPDDDAPAAKGGKGQKSAKATTADPAPEATTDPS